MAQKKKIQAPAIWPHEFATTQALENAGYTIEFTSSDNIPFTKSPDILFEGLLWEIKSPISGKLAAVERNLKKACHQSSNIIFDSLRITKLPDNSIQRELIKQFKLTRTIKRLLFVNKNREVIDIGKLV